MPIAHNVLNTMSPAIVEIHRLAERLRQSGRQLLDFGQAVPDFLPPEGCLDAVRDGLTQRTTHFYSPDPGLPALRRAIAADYRDRLGVEVDPDTEIMVTAGANHAFFQSLLCLVEAGQRVLVPSPYYFNHVMAMQLLGIEVVEWPMQVDTGEFVLDFDRLEQLDCSNIAAVVCINPNNPTGAVFPADQVERLVGECTRRNWTLFYDEVYCRLAFGDRPLRHPFTVDGGRSETIVLGSFSKMYGMTGWRVGYTLARPGIMEQLLKIQDTLLICAPVPGQLLAASCLETCPDALADYRRELRRRASRLGRIISDIRGLQWHAPQGALFGLVSYPGLESAMDMCRRLMVEEGIITVPGTAFGQSGEHRLRISFGFATDPMLDALDAGFRRCFRKTGQIRP